MPSGGARKGSGRPKGYKDVLKKSSALTPTARRELTNKLVAKAHEIDLSPIEVMLDTMKMFHDDAQSLIVAAGNEKNRAKKASLWHSAKVESLNAVSVAKDVAPYIHPKLQATTIRGDKENPLEVALGLMDSEVLKAAVRGQGL